jgi:E3 ubiquitin-protein ligase RNF14
LLPDPKKGSACHRMIDCSHVFCVQCLQDFYNNAITEGDLVSVRCLTPGCAKKRAESRPEKRRKAKSHLGPSELLQIPLEREMVIRYVNLKHKADLESDKNTIYCPRKWCQGAARSKKHRKPDGLEVVESDEEPESDAEEGGKGKFRAGNDLLCVCEDCSFAFCSRCYQGWHGEFTLCVPMTRTGELTEEDKASMEYLKLHTTPCPTCAAPAQKTHGCNHMICFKCNSHFCYLCSAWLEPENPYKHYNSENTGCYMRLWELEGGDGDDVGIGYGGGNHPPDPEEPDLIEAAPDDGDEEMGREGPAIPEAVGRAYNVPAAGIAAAEEPPVPHDALEPQQPAAPAPEQPPAPPAQELQREGPLVLRINAQPVPAPAPRAAPEPQPAQRQRGQRRGNPNRRVNPPPAQARLPGQAGGRARLLRGQQAVGRDQARDEAALAHQEWVQRFVQMALNDEEDQVEWDSDEEDAAAWQIPVR